VQDTVSACLIAWKKNKRAHYSIASPKSFSINQLAKMFNYRSRYLPKREGERFSSVLTKMNLNNKIIRLKAKIKITDYIKAFLEKTI
jgi:UDP-glucose 4-epimerase